MEPHNTDSPAPISDAVTSDAARRAYWTEQMQAGYELVEEIMAFEVHECGEGFASLRDAACSSGVEILFSDTKIADDIDRVFFLRESLVEDVVAIGRDMNRRGWLLKIEDGYRSREMQSRLVCKPAVFDAILDKCLWENGGRLPPVEDVFRRATVLVANLPKTGTHMSGSAIDISVFSRDDGGEVWRGGPYLEMSERTPMRSPFVDAEAVKNRLQITAIMESHGFVHFPYEFWHYNQGDALGHILRGQSAPARYGPVHWDPRTNRVEPYTDAHSPLIPPEQLEKEITEAVERARETA